MNSFFSRFSFYIFLLLLSIDSMATHDDQYDIEFDLNNIEYLCHRIENLKLKSNIENLKEYAENTTSEKEKFNNIARLKFIEQNREKLHYQACNKRSLRSFISCFRSRNIQQKNS